MYKAFLLDKASMSKVLVVDDDAINRMILEGMLIKEGHEVIQAENGQLAIDSYSTDNPDIILMDIMMPVMNGFDATKIIKELAGEVFVPIIVLTAMTDESELIKCVENGADDFLTKPFSHSVLSAKIQALMRVQDLYKTVSLQRDEIESNRKILHEEQEQASKIYKRMTLKDEIEGLNVRYHMSPMSVFNGDMLLMAQSPDGTCYTFLTDATGHGLPAALGSFPVRDIFYTMAGKGCSAQVILDELNRKLYEILPTEFFLCGAMLIISADKTRYQVWNGGLPEVIVYRPDTHQMIERIPSSNLPLGIVSADNYEVQLKDIEVIDGDSVLLYSDGATEAQKGPGEYFGEERFMEAVVQSKQFQVIESVIKAINVYCGDNSQTDDVSLVEHIVIRS